jgi:glycosyltransferase involved in cell wall biosynthesis
MRLALFSPMPPVRTGIAGYSAELVDALRDGHQVDVYVDRISPPSPAGPDGRATGSRSAHEFVWRHRQHPYDLVVYQLGNSSHHDYLWPYLFRYPGLAVLHDAHLHHARAAALLRERRAGDYRREFAAAHPEVGADAAEVAVAGFDSFLMYSWPFNRLIIAASRLTAVHSRPLRDGLRAAHPGARLEHIRMGEGIPVAEGAALAACRARARRRWGIADEAIVFGVFGGLTPEKRLPQILDAFAATLPYAPSARLLLAGAAAAHYDVAGDVAARGVGGRVILTGYLPGDEDLTDGIAASDATLNLRWPTAREMSGPWLRCLAAGRATVITELAHLSDVPALDPRTWRPAGAPGPAPVCVAIDILDEDHSLRLAMRRLAADAGLREALGTAARRYWTDEHSPQAMLQDYRAVLERAAAAEAPAPVLPAHLTTDRSERLGDILAPFGVPVPWSKI